MTRLRRRQFIGYRQLDGTTRGHMPNDIEQLMMKIEDYPFESEGGPLTNCTDWHRLKTEVRSLQSELAAVDSALARRPALDGAISRTAKVYLACKLAGDHDPKAELAKALIEIDRLKEHLATKV